MLDGEDAWNLSKEFGVTYNAIKKRFGSVVNQIKTVANQIVAVENNFRNLPVSSQIEVVNLTAKLRSISEHAAGAAEFGMMTAHRLSMLANVEAEKIDDARPMESIEVLKGIAGLTDIANKSSQIGLSLLNANRETVIQINQAEQKEKPRTLDEFYGKPLSKSQPS